MDFDGALKAGYSLQEVNAEAASRVKFNLDGAKQAGYSDDEIHQELRKRLGGKAAPKKRDTTWGEDTTNLLNAFGTAAKSKLHDTSRNIALGTIGLPSLGVDKLIGTVTGDEDYANPVTKYVANLVDTSNQAQQESAEAAKQGNAGFAGNLAGSVTGMVPDMIMGGAGSSGMKTMTGAADEAIPAIIAQAQKGFGMAQPLSVNAGLGRYEEALEKGHDAGTAAAAGLGSYGSMAVQGMAPMGMAGGRWARVGTGAAANVPLGIGGRQLENVTSPGNMQQNLYDPKAMIADAALGATMHGVMGERGGQSAQSKNLSRKPDLTNPAIETGLMTAGLEAARKDLAIQTQVLQDIQERIAQGDASKETLRALEEVEAIVQHHTDEVKAFENILGGKTDAVSDKAADAINQRQKQLDEMAERRGGGEQGPRELAPGEDAPFHESIPEDWRESVDLETGEIMRERPPEPAPTKQSPHEIALERIGEAMDNPVLAAKRLQEAQDKLDNLPKTEFKNDAPGSLYRSLKEALEAEIKAYTEIVAGRKPTLKEESIFRTPDEVVDAARNKNEAASDLEATRRTSEETKDIQAERQSLIEKPNKTVEDHLRIAELSDMYDEINVRNNPRNELKDTIQQLREELSDLKGQDDAYAMARRPVVENLLSKYGEFQRRAEAQARGDTPRTDVETLRIADQRPADDMMEPLPTILENLVQPNKFGDVEALLSNTKDKDGVWTEQTMRDLDDNPQLFDKHGANIFFDKRIAAPIQTVLKNLLKLTKFMDEKVHFVYDSNIPASGRQKNFGDATIIALNPERLRLNLDMNRNMTGFQKFMGTGSVDNALKIFHATRYLTHELGHALLNKYLRDSVTHLDDIRVLSKQFNDYAKKHGFKVNSVFDIFNQEQRQQYQDTFHEFFAERVASQLMHKHLLSSFGIDSPYIKSIGQLINNSIAYLKGEKIDLDEKNFADSILNDILNDSKEAIADTSESARYDIAQLKNDAYILESQRIDPESFPFYKKTMEEARLVLNQIPGMVRGGKGFDDMAQPVFGINAIIRLGHGLGRNLFGKLGASRIYFDDPLIKDTHDKIREAELKADQVNNKLWFGDVQKGDWDKKGFVARMSKVKLETSAYFQVKMAKPVDLAAVHDLFKKGFEQGLDYVNNYSVNGTHLTTPQVKLYSTLSKLFKEQFLEVQKLEKDLNKKNIISERPGWYPAVRQGQYFVDISFNGRTLHREQFRSKVEADQFRTKMQQTGAKNVVVSEAQHIKDNQQVSDMYGGLELAQNILEQKFPAARGPIRQTIQQALEKVITRGGKLGSHHKYRSNLSGYRGSELFYSLEDRGNSFAKAIQQSVNDYSGGLRKMMIQHTVDPILKASGLDPNAPNVQTAQMMRDSALNRVAPNAMEKIDRSIIEGWDSMMKAVYKEISPNQKGSFEDFHGKILEFFYLTKLMSKTVFPIGQLLTIAGAIREMSVEGGYIRPYISMAKGIAKIATGNKELNNILFDVSQKSNTFEPQFIEALHLGGQDGKTMKFLKDYVLLRKVNEAADSFSRLTVFASAFEMYKDLGLSVEDAKRKAMDDTNATMVPYGRTENAPIFNRMGIIGNAIKPLQTFGQQQLANWIHDFRYMKANDVKTWAPMLNYMLIATVLYGAMSPQFVQEYETIRAMLENFWPEHAPPPIIEVAKHTPDFLDRMFEDQQMVQKAMMYGIPAAALGVDVASSNRSNLTFLSLVGAVITGQENFANLMPHLNTVAGTVSGLATGVKAAAGGNVTDAQKRTAIQQVMPTGAFNYAVQDAFNVNEANIMGKPTGMTAGGKSNEAQVPLTAKERIAGYMGTKSTHERFKSDIQRAQVSQDRSRKAQVDKLYTLLIETSPEKAAARKVIIGKLVKLGQTPDSIANRIQKEAWDRKVPALTRSVVGQGGTIKETPDNLRKIQELKKYGPFDKAQP